MLDDTALIRFLAEKVCGWKCTKCGSTFGWVGSSGFVADSTWNPLREGREGWADFGTLWERVRTLGKSLRLYSSPHTPQSTAVVHTPETNEVPVVVADDDPKRAVCMAVAKAYGWKGEGDA